MLYGHLPKDLGLIDITNHEMMFWLYCPVKLPGSGLYYIPENLKWAAEIIIDAARDFTKSYPDRALKDHYVYVTAKTLFVSGAYIGNRPGWHSDGFGTDDINYIWCDRAPTQFLHLDPPRPLSSDCCESMQEMERLAYWTECVGPIDFEHTTFPDKHLLRLDQSVIHRSPVDFPPGLRTFVKVSISTDRYDLIGNSINHGLDFGPLVAARQPDRNHPQSRLSA